LEVLGGEHGRTVVEIQWLFLTVSNSDFLDLLLSLGIAVFKICLLLRQSSESVTDDGPPLLLRLFGRVVDGVTVVETLGVECHHGRVALVWLAIRSQALVIISFDPIDIGVAFRGLKSLE